MKTKAGIIQALLDEKKITVQEAMTLMEKEIQYIPYSQPYYWFNQPYIQSPIMIGGTYTATAGYANCTNSVN